MSQTLSESTRNIVVSALKEELDSLTKRVDEIKRDIRMFSGPEYTTTGTKEPLLRGEADYPKTERKRGRTATRRKVKGKFEFAGIKNAIETFLKTATIPVSAVQIEEALKDTYPARGRGQKHRRTSSVATALKGMYDRGEVERANGDNGRFIYLWKK